MSRLRPTRFVFGLLALFSSSTAFGQSALRFTTASRPVTALAALGDDLLVGANQDYGEDDGAVRLIEGATGAVLRTFLNPAGGTSHNDHFATAIAPDGPDVLVGAPREGIPPSGVAYLFDGGSAGLLQTFVNPNPDADPDFESWDNFGQALGANASGVLIGAPGGGLADEGIAYLFDRTAGTVLLTFGNPTPDPSDGFGYAIASVGGMVVVGSPRDDTAGPDAGAVHVFDASSGTFLRTVPNPTPSGGGLFGSALVTAGASVLVGAPGDDAGATNAGVTHVVDAETGSIIRTLPNPDPGVGAQFGATLAAIAADPLVGTRRAAFAEWTVGQAYRFDGATGTLIRRYVHPDATPAVVVGVAGGNAALGTRGPSYAGGNGNVYIFCGGAAGCGPCETCGPSGGCVPEPNPTCAAPTTDGRMLLKLTHGSSDARDVIHWKGRWFRDDDFGDDLDHRDLGNPTLALPGHDYALCLYDASGGSPALLMRVAAPASGQCNGRPCWTEAAGAALGFPAGGYRYRDSERTPHGLLGLRVTTLSGLWLKVLLNGKGPELSLPALPAPLPLRLQLQVRDGECLEATYSSGGVSQNTMTRLRALSD